MSGIGVNRNNNGTTSTSNALNGTQLNVTQQSGQLVGLQLIGQIQGQDASSPLFSSSNWILVDLHSISTLGYHSAQLQIAGNVNAGSLVLSESVAEGFSYQNYGYWASATISPFSLSTSAFSVGSATNPASIPVQGIATFTGESIGEAHDVGPVSYGYISSLVTASVDFSSRSITYQSSNTTGTTTTGSTAANTVTTSGPLPQFNMTGTLRYTAGSNLFSGTLATAGGWSGTANGQFYGPAANELGGIFNVSGPTGQSYYIGGFGGKRP